jgi:two-component system cell cycle response regulator DivK
MPVILVVDDEPENVELMARRLARRGFTVRGAATAAEGIVSAKTDPPDLILMDVKMPGMDGYEATAVLKGDPVTAAIPIIALTAHAMQEDRERAVAAGVNGYETKPVDFAKLLEKISALLAAAAPS